MKKDFNIDKERNYGWSREDIMKPYIEKNLNTELNKYQEQFATFDYYNEKYEIELKSRRVKHNKYPSTMIGVNKYTEGLEHIKQGKLVYFFFNFIDGLYVYQLKENDKLEIKIGGRYDTGIFKDYCYININQLTKCKYQKQ